MKDIKKYFDAPLFESSKSVYAVRYQTKLEQNLMQRFENEPKIKNYFQPILTALVKDSNREFFINVDFWVELVTGKIELVYLETEIEISREAKVTLFTNPKEVLKTGNFGFVIFRQDKFRRIECRNLKLDLSAVFTDYCFVSFDRIN